jgi:hypothetical protein
VEDSGPYRLQGQMKSGKRFGVPEKQEAADPQMVAQSLEYGFLSALLK